MLRFRSAGVMLVAVAWSAVLGLRTIDLEAATATSVALESFAVQHPIAVRVTALDPIRRGETIRVRLEVRTRVDLQRTEARLVSAGGAAPIGASRASIGRMRPDRPAATEFRVRVPERGRRFLLQFRVFGEGTQGQLSRGATLNLLPDGPADPGREVVIQGERVIEHRARRIDR